MGQILRNPSLETVNHAIEENQRNFFLEFFRHWPGSVSYEEDGMTRFRSSGQNPLFNAVLNFKGESRDLDAQIQAMQSEHAHHSVPLGWLLWPTSSRSVNRERLLRHGFVHALDLIGMSLNIADLQPQTLHPGVSITEVQNAEDLARWMEPCRISFEFTDLDADGFYRGLLGMGFGGDSPVHHYIAWEAGRPVACSSLYLSAGVAGIYDVATLPEARGRGIGTAIAQQPVLVAREQGYNVAILHSTPMGDRVYRRLGFRENCRIGFYAWGMTDH